MKKTFKIFIHSKVLIAFTVLYIVKSSKFQIIYFESSEVQINETLM